MHAGPPMASLTKHSSSDCSLACSMGERTVNTAGVSFADIAKIFAMQDLSIFLQSGDIQSSTTFLLQISEMMGGNLNTVGPSNQTIAARSAGEISHVHTRFHTTTEHERSKTNMDNFNPLLGGLSKLLETRWVWLMSAQNLEGTRALVNHAC